MDQAADRRRVGTGAVWSVAVAIYLLAVFHRSSLAVAGLAASERFDITAAQLSTFIVLQLVVYAGMQVPVGLLLDRFGSRRMLVGAILVLTAGQTAFAFAETFPVALVARAFVGVGDAMTFICVLRLVNAWFTPRRIPLATQLTGQIGQLGALAAAAPMTWALGTLGWTRSYLIAAMAGPVLLVALLVVVRDTPDARVARGPAIDLAEIRASIAASWAHPGTRLGFWAHFTTMFSSTTLALLWGYPFFVQGEGRSSSTAGALLSLLVVSTMVAGPVMGHLVSRQPFRRSTYVLTVVWAIVGVWTVVLVWPGEAPLPVLAVLVLVVGIGGPASVVGFDLGRTSNPAHRQGSAIGLINQAGFLATLLLVLAIGFVLDWRTPGDSTDYSPAAFRWAMSCQYVLWAIGLVQLWRYRHRARRRLRDDDPDEFARQAPVRRRRADGPA